MTTPDRIPVIIAIGEVTDRPQQPDQALEPVALMAEALRVADADGGGGLLGEIDTLSLVGQITWPYANAVGSLCEKLGIAPANPVNASMGGETPIRLLHEAALRIASGEGRVSAIVGGESMHALGKARKAGVTLDWTPPVPRDQVPRLDGSWLKISPQSKAMGVVSPAQLYPLYENAWQAREGQSPEQGRKSAADLWSLYANVAAENPYAWIRNKPSPQEIETVGPANRMIAWPYPKLMVANPTVNQSAAIIVTSLERARAAGIPEGRLVYVWGGAKAAEVDDYLYRDRFDGSTAQTAVLDRAVEVAGGDAKAFDHIELYSCFPVVPKMALSVLGLPADTTPTVAGGITFFGGPMNNYMSHAICGMVRKLRQHPGDMGLLYGQGGFVNKHHAVVVSSRPPAGPLSTDISVQDQADQTRGPVPPLTNDYQGPASIETFTVLYDRDGEVDQGVVVARTPAGERLLARVERTDPAGLAVLTRLEATAIGAAGTVTANPDGILLWTAA